MGPKYEFTNETTKACDGTILHRIRRISDGKLGGYIEKENNLSQDGGCWVDEDAQVYNNAKVYDNALISGHAKVCDDAIVFGNAKVYDDAEVCGGAHVYNNSKIYKHALVCGYTYIRGDTNIYGNAQVYDFAHIFDKAIIHGNAKVYDKAIVFGNAKIYGNAKVCGNVKIFSGEYNGEEADVSNEIIQNFINKIIDSNKLTTQTEYDSIEEFFSEPIKNDIKLDTLIISTIDTKEPLIKLQRVEVDNKTEFKFIVDIINEDGDDFIFRSIIKSQEHLNQLIQQTINSLKNYSKFNKYADDLENCL